jgi:hypothetical protein
MAFIYEKGATPTRWNTAITTLINKHNDTAPAVVNQASEDRSNGRDEIFDVRIANMWIAGAAP